MNETRWDAGFSTEWSSPVLDDIVELPLLLLRQEADALERAARRRNTTPGELLRRLVWVFVQGEANRRGRPA